MITALDKVADIIKNPDYVNGGLGDVASIATTPYGDAGLPILDGDCWLHRQSSSYQANWPAETKVAEDGDVFALAMPGENAAEQPLLLSGDSASPSPTGPWLGPFRHI